MSNSLEFTFEPIIIKVNGVDFVVELKPRYAERYSVPYEFCDDEMTRWWDDLKKETTLDQLVDMNGRGAGMPQEFVVWYVSWEKTIGVAFSGKCETVITSSIRVASTDFGFYATALLMVDGKAARATGVNIAVTTPDDKSAITKEREALAFAKEEKARSIKVVGDISAKLETAEVIEYIGMKWEISKGCLTVNEVIKGRKPKKHAVDSPSCREALKFLVKAMAVSEDTAVHKSKLCEAVRSALNHKGAECKPSNFFRERRGGKTQRMPFAKILAHDGHGMYWLDA